MSFDLVIRGGTVASTGGVAKADVGITAGRIEAVGTNLQGGAEEIDAKGKIVVPPPAR